VLALIGGAGRSGQRLDESALADWHAGCNAIYPLATLTIGARLVVATVLARIFPHACVRARARKKCFTLVPQGLWHLVMIRPAPPGKNNSADTGIQIIHNVLAR